MSIKPQIFQFGDRSESYLATVEPALVGVSRVALAGSRYDFGVICGIRTVEEQRAEVESGNSWTMDSRHLPNQNGLSEAIDILVYDENGKPTYEIGYYRVVAQSFVTAAIANRVFIELGCLWKNVVDGMHIQLRRN